MNWRFGDTALKLQDVAYCLLCTQPIRNATCLTSCGHVFCRECLTVYSDMRVTCASRQRAPSSADLTSYTSVSCPTCLRDSRNPAQVQNKIPECNAIGQALKHVKVVKAEESKKDCQGCQESKAKRVGKAKWLCITCHHEYCQRCHVTHPESHDVIRNTPPVVMTCSAHSKEKPSLYCRTCAVPMCQKCLKNHGAGHDVTELPRVLASHVAALNHAKDAAGELLDAKVNRLDEIKVFWQSQDTKMRETIQDLNRHCDSLVHQIRQRQKEFDDRLRQHFQETKTLAENHENYLKYTIRVLYRLQHFTQRVTSSNQEPLLLFHAEPLQRRLSAFSDRSAADREAGAVSRLRQAPGFTPTPRAEVGNLVMTTLDFPQQGDTDDVIRRRPSDVESSGDTRNATGRTLQHLSISLRDRPRLQWQQLYQAESPGQERYSKSRPHGLIFLPNDLLIVAESEGKRLHFLDNDNGHFRESDTISHPTWMPRDVTFNRHGALFVTDDSDKVVKVIAEQEAPIKTLAYKKKAYKFISPSCIAIDSADHVIVSDMVSQDVSLLSSLGQFITKLSPGDQGTVRAIPEFVASDDARNRILVSSRGDCRVKLYDTNGTLLRHFLLPLDSNGQRSAPGGICTDPLGNIIVSDTSRQRISLFDPDGRFIQDILTFDLGSIFPFCLALSGSGQLAMSDRAVDMVSCYEVYC